VLKVDTGVRAIGLGGAYTAAGRDVESINYNPAGLSFITLRDIEYMHWFSFSGISVEQASYAQYLDTPVFEGNGGISLVYRHMDAIANGDATDPAVDFYDFVLTGAIANSLYSVIKEDFYKNFRYGIAGKIILEHIGVNQASTFAGDVGGLFTVPNTSLTLGMSLQNVGAPIKFINDASPLPITLRIGVDFTQVIDKQNTGEITMDYIHDFYDYPRIALGLEDSMGKLIFWRLGYNAPFDTRSPAQGSVGFGISFTQFDVNVKLNYVYRPVLWNGFNAVESTHMAGLEIRL
jgi:hypothetical protein